MGFRKRESYLVVRSSINFTTVCHCERQRSNLEFLLIEGLPRRYRSSQ